MYPYRRDCQKKASYSKIFIILNVSSVLAAIDIFPHGFFDAFFENIRLHSFDERVNAIGFIWAITLVDPNPELIEPRV